jgi:hypothetical protein
MAGPCVDGTSSSGCARVDVSIRVRAPVFDVVARIAKVGTLGRGAAPVPRPEVEVSAPLDLPDAPRVALILSPRAPIEGVMRFHLFGEVDGRWRRLGAVATGAGGEARLVSATSELEGSTRLAVALAPVEAPPVAPGLRGPDDTLRWRYFEPLTERTNTP